MRTGVLFYPKNLKNVSLHTLWVQCFAHEVKGKSDNRLINFKKGLKAATTMSFKEL